MYWVIRMVAAMQMTEKEMSSRLVMTLALPIAATAVGEVRATIIWSTLLTSIWRTSSTKIGQVSWKRYPRELTF